MLWRQKITSRSYRTLRTYGVMETNNFSLYFRSISTYALSDGNK